MGQTGDLLPDPTDPVAMPAFTAPTLPAGVTAQPPGLLTRLFALIARVKLAAGYTDAIGPDLQIIGAEDAGDETKPKFTATREQGASSQRDDTRRDQRLRC